MKNTKLVVCFSLLFLFVKIQAQVIYTDLFPDRIVSAPQNLTAYLSFDLNRDGTFDFVIGHHNFPFQKQAVFNTRDGQLGEIIRAGTGSNRPKALNINDKIDSTQSTWIYGSWMHMHENGTFVGQQNKFVGLRIKINNQWHYGWVSLSIPSDTSEIVVYSYAYEQSPNTAICAGQTTTGGCATGISDLLNEKNNLISAYPNPFNFSATIQFPVTINNGELHMYNLYGQIVKTINHISGNEIKILRDNLPSGIYFVCLIQDDKTISTGKLIIKD